MPIPFSSRQLRRLTQMLPTLLQHKLAADRRRRKAHERSNRHGSPARSARTLAQQASEGCYTSCKLGTECSSPTATVPGSHFAGARLLRAILCSTTPTTRRCEKQTPAITSYKLHTKQDRSARRNGRWRPGHPKGPCPRLGAKDASMHGGGRRLGQGLEDQKSSRRRDTLGRGTECQGRVTVQTSQQPQRHFWFGEEYFRTVKST